MFGLWDFGAASFIKRRTSVYGIWAAYWFPLTFLTARFWRHGRHAQIFGQIFENASKNWFLGQCFWVRAYNLKLQLGRRNTVSPDSARAGPVGPRQSRLGVCPPRSLVSPSSCALIGIALIRAHGLLSAATATSQDKLWEACSARQSWAASHSIIHADFWGTGTSWLGSITPGTCAVYCPPLSACTWRHHCAIGTGYSYICSSCTTHNPFRIYGVPRRVAPTSITQGCACDFSIVVRPCRPFASCERLQLQSWHTALFECWSPRLHSVRRSWPLPLVVGASIQVCGVTSRPELNGQHGTVQAFHSERNRFAVKLTELDSPLLFKRENLPVVTLQWFM